MDIKTSKIELAKIILDIENPSLIQKIYNLVTQETGDFWQTLSDRDKSEIQLGISQLNKKERIPFDEYLDKVS